MYLVVPGRTPSYSADLRSRRRKVKCDGLRPAYAKCTKSNRQCLGFEDSNLLIVKDETEKTMKRYSRGKDKMKTREGVAENQSTGPRVSSQIDIMEELGERSLAQSNSSHCHTISTSALSRLYERQQVAL